MVTDLKHICAKLRGIKHLQPFYEVVCRKYLKCLSCKKKPDSVSPILYTIDDRNLNFSFLPCGVSVFMTIIPTDENAPPFTTCTSGIRLTFDNGYIDFPYSAIVLDQDYRIEITKCAEFQGEITGDVNTFDFANSWNCLPAARVGQINKTFQSEEQINDLVKRSKPLSRNTKDGN